MKVLITGAAGFMGRHFAMFHAERGDTVHCLDDLSSQWAKWPMHERINSVKGDAGLFFDGWSEAIRVDYDLVYHFAAPVGGREKIEGDPMFNAGSLRLDASLFRWAAKFGKRTTVVYPSSSAVYDISDQAKHTQQALTEDDFHPSPASDRWWPVPDEIYGLTKLVGEVLAWRAQKYDVDTLCIRPFSGYGEDQSPEYPVPSICRRVAEKQDPLIVWGSGQQARDFIYIDDVVGATVARLEAGIDGYQRMNIGTGEFHTFNRVAQMAAAGNYDSPPSIENLSDKPEGVHMRFCDPTEMLKYYKPVVPLEDGLGRVVRAHAIVAEGIFQ
jgi:GDP-L-fucose synthase